ncbi:MAG: hypothetical protein N2690_08335, partial [Rhodocyclaceae bacterium]|nr:hypothetical protein [Rhodocyclaceae bacterium]
GKTGRVTVLHDLPGVTAPRVLVVGLGDAGKFGPAAYRKAVAEAVRALLATAGFTALEQHRDLAGIVRVSGGRMPD